MWLVPFPIPPIRHPSPHFIIAIIIIIIIVVTGEIVMLAR
jgi:hypothetical protein